LRHLLRMLDFLTLNEQLQKSILLGLQIHETKHPGSILPNYPKASFFPPRKKDSQGTDQKKKINKVLPRLLIPEAKRALLIKRLSKDVL